MIADDLDKSQRRVAEAQALVGQLNRTKYRVFIALVSLFLTVTNMRTMVESIFLLPSITGGDDPGLESAKSDGYFRQTPTPDQRRKRPSIVLYGDSLTQRGFGEDGNVGWASLLASAYTRRADVKNRGFGGYNTHHALHVLPNILDSFDDKVLFTTIFFGANDAALPGERQHLSLDEYAHNLQKIVETIRARMKRSNPSSDALVILFTPPPVDEVAWAHFRKQEANRKNSVAREYGLRVHDVARQHDCAVLDTWELLDGNNSTNYPQYLSDGLHLNEEGNRLIYEGLMDLLKSEYPSLAPKIGGQLHGIPFQEPSWQEYE